MSPLHAAVPPPAVIDDYISRIDDLEQNVELMMNRFIAISAAAEIPLEHVTDSAPSGSEHPGAV